jgi:hypothetical protein
MLSQKRQSIKYKKSRKRFVRKQQKSGARRLASKKNRKYRKRTQTGGDLFKCWRKKKPKPKPSADITADITADNDAVNTLDGVIKTKFTSQEYQNLSTEDQLAQLTTYVSGILKQTYNEEFKVGNISTTKANFIEVLLSTKFINRLQSVKAIIDIVIDLVKPVKQSPDKTREDMTPDKTQDDMTPKEKEEEEEREIYSICLDVYLNCVKTINFDNNNKQYLKIFYGFWAVGGTQSRLSKATKIIDDANMGLQLIVTKNINDQKELNAHITDKNTNLYKQIINALDDKNNYQDTSFKIDPLRSIEEKKEEPSVRENIEQKLNDIIEKLNAYINEYSPTKNNIENQAYAIAYKKATTELLGIDADPVLVAANTVENKLKIAVEAVAVAVKELDNAIKQYNDKFPYDDNNIKAAAAAKKIAAQAAETEAIDAAIKAKVETNAIEAAAKKEAAITVAGNESITQIAHDKVKAKATQRLNEYEILKEKAIAVAIQLAENGVYDNSALKVIKTLVDGSSNCFNPSTLTMLKELLDYEKNQGESDITKNDYYPYFIKGLKKLIEELETNQ